MNTPPVVEVSNVSKSYAGRRVVDISSLRVDAGELCVLTGHNGAGKTTLLRLIAGLDTPDAGRITLGVARSAIGFCFQKPYMFRGTVRDNIGWGMKRKEGNVKTAVAEAAKQAGIGRLLDIKAKTLSAGEMQKVSLARALVRRPRLLLLDEPAANLDEAGVETLECVIRRHVAEGGACMMATHMHEHALRMCGRFVRLEHGAVAAQDDVFNVFDGRAETSGEGAVITVEDAVRIACASMAHVGPVRFAVAASDVVLAASPMHSSMRNCFSGAVTAIRPCGAATVEVTVDVGMPLRALVTAQSAYQMRLAPGSEVYAAFKATAVRVLKGGL
mgnify:CR=1 FL=1